MSVHMLLTAQLSERKIVTSLESARVRCLVQLTPFASQSLQVSIHLSQSEKLEFL